MWRFMSFVSFFLLYSCVLFRFVWLELLFMWPTWKSPVTILGDLVIHNLFFPHNAELHPEVLSCVRCIGKSECGLRHCVVMCVCLLVCECLIMGQGRPRAHSGPGSLRPLRFQSRAFLHGCSIAVKTAKQLQQQTRKALGERRLTCS